MILTVILLCVAALIVVVEGPGAGPFALWNCVPVLTVYILFKIAFRIFGNWEQTPIPRKAALIGFMLFSLGFTLYLHLAWALNLGKLKTGASTSGLIFIFIPPYSLILGCLGALVGWLIAKWLARRKPVNAQSLKASP